MDLPNLVDGLFPSDKLKLQFIFSSAPTADVLKVHAEFLGSPPMPKTHLVQQRRGKRTNLTCRFHAAVWKMLNTPVSGISEMNTNIYSFIRFHRPEQYNRQQDHVAEARVYLLVCASAPPIIRLQLRKAHICMLLCGMCELNIFSTRSESKFLTNVCI